MGTEKFAVFETLYGTEIEEKLLIIPETSSHNSVG